MKTLKCYYLTPGCILFSVHIKDIAHIHLLLSPTSCWRVRINLNVKLTICYIKTYIFIKLTFEDDSLTNRNCSCMYICNTVVKEHKSFSYISTWTFVIIHFAKKVKNYSNTIMKLKVKLMIENDLSYRELTWLSSKYSKRREETATIRSYFWVSQKQTSYRDTFSRVEIINLYS